MLDRRSIHSMLYISTRLPTECSTGTRVLPFLSAVISIYALQSNRDLFVARTISSRLFTSFLARSLYFRNSFLKRTKIRRRFRLRGQSLRSLETLRVWLKKFVNYRKRRLRSVFWKRSVSRWFRLASRAFLRSVFVARSETSNLGT